MLNKLLSSIAVKLITALAVTLGTVVINWLGDKKDRKKIDDALKNKDPIEGARDLNDAFRDL